jgi:hypothetical protein
MEGLLKQSWAMLNWLLVSNTIGHFGPLGTVSWIYG